MKKSIFPILGILVAIIGIGAPILWDTLRSKQSLEIQIVSSISLLENDPIMDKLEIRYEDKKIQDLTKFIFVLINSGRRPIVEEHVKCFPMITFGPESEILSAEVLRSDPKDLGAKIDIDVEKLTIKFPLMNPTDFIEFNAYVSGYSRITPEITSRIQGIKSLNVVNKTLEVPSSKRTAGWKVYIVGIFTLFAVIVTFVLFWMLLQQLRARKLVRAQPGILANLKNKGEFERFIQKNLGFLSDNEKGELQQLLATWKESDDDTSQTRDRLANLIQRRISDLSGNVGGFAAMFIFSAIGVYFLLKWLVF